MGTLWEERIWVVLMFIGYMSHYWLPFCKDQVLKALLSGTRTPINMVLNTFHPFLYYSTSRLLTCFKHFFANRTGNMPNVIEVFGLRSALSDPLSDTSVAVWNEYCNRNSSCKQEVKTPLCSLQFHVGRTATCLIGLQAIRNVIWQTSRQYNSFSIIIWFIVNCFREREKKLIEIFIKKDETSAHSR